ncbi:MAG: hypothetical protein MUF49_30520 [Oculatellaceae cyanobacterium Prado106]|jgi:hypothetical protein|nr:hypothetical protein [Oculatellaceae cyanobacterium Prado106]
MPSAKERRLTLKALSLDMIAFNGLKSIDDYQPSRSELTVDAIERSCQKMLAAQRRTIELQALLKDAIAAQQTAEKTFHTQIREMKNSVRGQYGSDSHEVVAIGLTKWSERKPPNRSKKAN